MRELESDEPSRERSNLLCRKVYDRIKRDRFYYALEPASARKSVQRIRSPNEIDALNCATCLDLACLFASMLESAHQPPVIVVTDSQAGAHALGGYKTPDAPYWAANPTLGDLRGAVRRGELVVFETTGAVEARGRTVAAETEEERREGGGMLDYRTAKEAANRLLHLNELELRHFIDVEEVRKQRNNI